MIGPSNLNVYEHRFINNSTIETTKRGPHKVHNRKYMEVGGHCRDYDFRLSIHSGDIGITVQE